MNRILRQFYEGSGVLMAVFMLLFGTGAFAQSQPLGLERVRVIGTTSNTARNGSVELFVRGGLLPYRYCFAARPCDTMRLFSNLAMGSYRVRVFDQRGDSLTFTVTVGRRLAFERIDFIQDASAAGATDAIASVLALGGRPPYVFRVNNDPLFRPDTIIMNLRGGDSAIFRVRDIDNNIVSRRVYVPIRLTASVRVRHVSAPNRRDGQITLSAQHGIPPYQFSKDDGITFGTDSVFTDLAVGQYNLQVRDSRGKIFRLEAFVRQSLAFTATVTHPSTPTAQDGSITLRVTGGAEPYNFSLNNEFFATGNFTRLRAGSYSVVVTDDDGNRFAQTIILSAKLSATAQLVHTTGDNTSDGQIQIIPTGGTSPYTYSLNGGTAQQSNTFTGLRRGRYTVVVRDARNANVTLSVEIMRALSARITVRGAGENNNDGEMVITPTGGRPPYRFALDNFLPQTLNSFAGLSAGEYRIRVLDAADNIFTQTVIVPRRLTATATVFAADNDSVANGSIIFRPSGGRPPYRFAINNGAFVDNSIFTNLRVGSYAARVRDASDETINFTVVVPRKMSARLVATDDDGTGNGTLTVVVDGGALPITARLSRNLPTTNLTFDQLREGTYPITVSDAIGQQIQLNGRVYRALDFSHKIVGVSHNGMNDGRVEVRSIIGGVPPYRITVNGLPVINATANNLPEGQVRIRVQDSGGVRLKERLLLIPRRLRPAPRVTLLPNALMNFDLRMTASGGVRPFRYQFEGRPFQQDSFISNVQRPQNEFAYLYNVAVSDANNDTILAKVRIFNNAPLRGNALTDRTVTTDVSRRNARDGKIFLFANDRRYLCTEAEFNNRTVRDLVINEVIRQFRITVRDLRSGFVRTLPGTTTVLDSLSPGSYEVRYTHENGSVITDLVNIKEPDCSRSVVASILGSNAVCEGDTMVVEVVGIEDNPRIILNWSIPFVHRHVGSFAQRFTFVPRTANRLTLTAIDSLTGCVYSTSVSYDFTPKVSIHPIPETGVICSSGQSIRLIAKGGGTDSYSWSPTVGLSAATGNEVTANPTASTTYYVTAIGGQCAGRRDSIRIVVGGGFEAFRLSTNSAQVCDGRPIQVSAHGATSYRWRPALGVSDTTASTVILSPTQTTVYTAVGRSAGCEFTRLVRVEVLQPQPLFVETTTPTICAGQVATLRVRGTGAFTWLPTPGLIDTAGAEVRVAPNQTTTYTVRQILANGCRARGVITVNVLPLPQITLNVDNPTICAGNTVNVTASGATSYLWSPSHLITAGQGHTVTLRPTATTVFTVTGTRDGCSATRTVTVTVRPFPSFRATADRLTVCAGSPVMLSAEGGANTVRWIGVPAQQATLRNVTVTPLTTTTYAVESIEDGCTVRATVTVNVVPAPSTPFNVFPNSSISRCAGDTVTLRASGGTQLFRWLPETGLNTTTGAVVIARPLVTTVYSVLDMGATCTGVRTIQVVVNPSLTVALSATPAPNGSISATVNGGTPPFGYALGQGHFQDQSRFEGLAAGTYVVRVIDARGCTASATVTIDPTVSPSCGTPLQPTASGITATGVTITWPSVNGALSYDVAVQGTTLTSNTNALTLTNLIPNTTYDVRVRAVCSGQVRSSFSQVVRFTTLNAATPSCLLDQSLVTLRPSARAIAVTWPLLPQASQRVVVRWRRTGTTAWTTAMPNSSTTSYTISGLAVDTGYEVQLGVICSLGTAPIYGQILPTRTLNAKATHDALTACSTTVYPNPNQGDFTLRLTGAVSGLASIRVLNSLGQTVYTSEQALIDGDNSFLIRLMGAESGVYFVSITTAEHNFLQRIVVR